MLIFQEGFQSICANMPNKLSHIAMLCTTYSNVDVQEFNLSDILTNTVGYHVKFVVSLYS